MDVIQTIKSVRAKLAKQIGLGYIGENIKEDQKLGVDVSWLYSALLGQPRGVDISKLREFSKSIWFKMVSNHLIKEVLNTEWILVPRDKNEDIKNYSRQVNQVNNFFTLVNRNKDDIDDIIRKVVSDVIEIDAGSIVKVKDDRGKLVELWSRDGSSFLIKKNRNGILENYFQYSWKHPTAAPIRFEPNELSYWMMYPSTYRMYGWSPLQSIVQVLELMIQSTRFNKEYFKKNAIPDGMISILTDPKNLREIESKWNKKIRGRAHKLAFASADVKFTPFNMSNKDMEWLDGQKWYSHLVFAAYGLSPTEVGFYENSNRATEQGQGVKSTKNAIKPYLRLVEKRLNCDIIPDILGEDFPPIMFKYDDEDSEEEKYRDQLMLQEIDKNIITINEYRSMNGLDPVSWGEVPYSMMLQQSYKEQEDTETEETEDQKKNDKSFINKEITGEEIVEESEPYDNFMIKVYDIWRKNIISGIKANPEIFTSVEKKSVDDMVSRIFNGITSMKFYVQLKDIIKGLVKTGEEEAKIDTNKFIGLTPESFNRTASFFAEQQLNGYTLPDGTKWVGIKGVANDTQIDIYTTIQNAISNKKSQSEVIEEVNKYFDGQENTRATAIARTESNRIVNQAKQTTIKENNLGGFKVYEAWIDNKTSDICRRLNGQKVPIDEDFYDEVTGKRFSSPPAHVNCRSSFRWQVE